MVCGFLNSSIQRSRVKRNSCGIPFSKPAHKRECSQIRQIADSAADIKDMVHEIAKEVKELRDVELS